MTRTETDPTAATRTDPKGPAMTAKPTNALGLPAGSYDYFCDLANDAGNWSGNPWFDGNVSAGRSTPGYVARLVKAGLIESHYDDEQHMAFCVFTVAGIVAAAKIGIDLSWLDEAPDEVKTQFARPDLHPVGSRVSVIGNDTNGNKAGDVGIVVESFAPHAGRNIQLPNGRIVNVSDLNLTDAPAPVPVTPQYTIVATDRSGATVAVYVGSNEYTAHMAYVAALKLAREFKNFVAVDWADRTGAIDPDGHWTERVNLDALHAQALDVHAAHFPFDAAVSDTVPEPGRDTDGKGRPIINMPYVYAGQSHDSYAAITTDGYAVRPAPEPTPIKVDDQMHHDITDAPVGAHVAFDHTEPLLKVTAGQVGMVVKSFALHAGRMVQLSDGRVVNCSNVELSPAPTPVNVDGTGSGRCVTCDNAGNTRPLDYSWTVSYSDGSRRTFCSTHLPALPWPPPPLTRDFDCCAPAFPGNQPAGDQNDANR